MAQSPVRLANAGFNQPCNVVAVAFDRPELQSRLYAMGVYPGATITVLRAAPLGDPLQVLAGRTTLSIRRVDAEAVQVTPS